MTEYAQKIRVNRVQEPVVRVRVKPRVPPLEIEMQNTGTMVQWRLGTTGAWVDLIEIDDINASVSVGTVTTLPAGSPATVVNVGTVQDVILDFGIPEGGVSSVNGETGVVTIDAGDVPFTPTGAVSAATVQAAIAEVDSEKLSIVAAAAGYQPLDADLTAIAALATQTFGRSRLTDTSAADNRLATATPAYVATRTALKALDTSKDTVAILTEAGRESTWNFRAGNYAALVAADADEVRYIAANAVATTTGAWVQAVVVPAGISTGAAMVSVLRYIPTSLHATIFSRSITTDLSTYINAALAAETCLYFPPGRYPITAVTISQDGTKLVGAGAGSNGAEFYKLTGTGDAVTAYGKTGVNVSGFRWSAAVAQTAGYYYVPGSYGILADFYMAAPFMGIAISQGDTLVTNGYLVDIVASTGHGIDVLFGSGLRIHDVIATCNTASQPRAAVYVTKCFDLIISDCDFYGCGYDLELAPTAGDGIGSIFAINTFFDTATRGVYAHPLTAGFITRCSFSNCWFGGHTQEGVGLDATGGGIDDIVFSNCRVSDNDSDGFKTVGAVKNITLTGNSFSFNGGAAISLSSTTIRAAITGNFIGQTETIGANAYGVYLNSGVDQYAITGNIFGTNTTQIVGHNPSPTRIANDNIGLGATQIALQPQISTQLADFTGSNVNTAQSVFTGAQDTLTLLSDVTYRFKAKYFITRAAGTTSHTTGVLFGGTATFDAVDYTAMVTNPTGNALATIQQIEGTSASLTTLTAANTSATENLLITLEGTIRTNVGGTVVPQFQYSAAPGGAPTIKANSFFELWPIGTDQVAAVGNWA